MNRILQLLYAPDTDTAGGASPMTLDIPELPSAAAESTIETVEFAPSIAESVPGVMGPKEALGDDGTEEMERMEAKMEGRQPRERGPDGKFLPKGAKKDDAKKPEGKPEAKPVVKTPAKPVQKPAAAKPVVAAEPAKVKIGDEEKTAEEWAAEITENRAKAKAIEAAKPEPPKEPEQPALKPEEIEAERKAKMDGFLAKASEQYKMTPQELDDMLAGGEKAVHVFATSLAKVEANTRQWAVQEFNKISAALWDRMNPLVEHHGLIAEYQRDNGFLDANPEIKSHPEGYKTYRETRQEIIGGQERIKAAITAGTATQQEKAWSAFCDTLTPEQIGENIARLTKEKIAKLTPAPSPNATKPEAKQVARSQAANKPFNGDRPGGGQSAPVHETADARALREMSEYGH